MKSKRNLAIAAIALLAAAVFMSCSKSDGGSSSAQASASGGSAPSNKLTIWTWDPNFNIYAMNKAAEIYAKDHPGFTIEISEIQSDDIETRLTTIAASRDFSLLPDIFLMQDNSFKKYVTYYPELFTDLTNSGIDFSEFAPSKLAYSELNGKNYGVPFDNGAVINCVRTDYLAQAGYTPEDFNDITWEEYIEKGKVVRAATGLPMLTAQAGSPDQILIMLYSVGAALFHEDGSVYIADNDILRQCMELYVEMVKEGILVEVTDWDQYIASINNGTVVSALQGCWIMATVVSQPTQDGKWAVINMPRLSGVPGATQYSSNGGSSWVVSSSSSNPDLAIDFLKSTFAGSTELYDDLITKGALATWSPAADSPAYNQPVEFFNGQAVYSLIVDFSTKVPTFVTSPFHYDARDGIGVALSNIIQRGGNMDAELKDAQAFVEFNMEE